jgi:hypothetical protein
MRNSFFQLLCFLQLFEQRKSQEFFQLESKHNSLLCFHPRIYISSKYFKINVRTWRFLQIWTYTKILSHLACKDHNCTHAGGVASQSLDELEFERGIWNAAISGDLTKVKKFVEGGKPPDLRDQFGN